MDQKIGDFEIWFVCKRRRTSGVQNINTYYRSHYAIIVAKTNKTKKGIMNIMEKPILELMI